MKKRVIPVTGLSVLFSAVAAATPAMTVLTVNTADPMAYAEWTKSSGEAFAKSVGAGVGGICLASGVLIRFPQAGLSATSDGQILG